MRVLWTTTAAGDLAHIVEYIRKDNPAAARRVAQTILRRHRCATYISAARTHRSAENIRELVFTPLPYIAVYEIIEDQVQVLRIRHAAQDWP